MSNYAEQSVYDHCKHDIETNFDTIIAAPSTTSDADAIRLSIAWLYGGLPAVFIWDNAAAIGIDYNEWQYYIGRLQSTIIRLNNLSIAAAEPPECRSAYLHFIQILQNIHSRLMAVKPSSFPLQP